MNYHSGLYCVYGRSDKATGYLGIKPDTHTHIMIVPRFGMPFRQFSLFLNNMISSRRVQWLVVSGKLYHIDRGTSCLEYIEQMSNANFSKLYDELGFLKALLKENRTMQGTGIFLVFHHCLFFSFSTIEECKLHGNLLSLQMDTTSYCRNISLGPFEDSDFIKSFYAFQLRIHYEFPAIEMKVNHNCVESELDVSVNFTNIVGWGNVLAFNKVNRHGLLIWALGIEYMHQLRLSRTVHPTGYRSTVQIDWKSVLSCSNSSFHFILHNGGLFNRFPPSITTKTSSGMSLHYLHYHGRVHIIFDPLKEFKNKSYVEVVELCREVNGSPFYFLSDTEMEYVLDWLFYHGTKGAPVFIFTNLRKPKVCMLSIANLLDIDN